MIAGHFFLFGCGVVTSGVGLVAYLLCGKRRERKTADAMRKHLMQIGGAQ